MFGWKVSFWLLSRKLNEWFECCAAHRLLEDILRNFPSTNLKMEKTNGISARSTKIFPNTFLLFVLRRWRRRRRRGRRRRKISVALFLSLVQIVSIDLNIEDNLSRQDLSWSHSSVRRIRWESIVYQWFSHLNHPHLLAALLPTRSIIYIFFFRPSFQMSDLEDHVYEQIDSLRESPPATPRRLLGTRSPSPSRVLVS